MSVHQSVSAVILAAGKGTRMKSSKPKVLHPVAGKAMLSWVIEAVELAGIKDITLVLNSDVTQFMTFFENYPDLKVAIQTTQLGTGDAVASAAPAFKGITMPSYASGRLERGEPATAQWILVTAGDSPAISPSTIKSFLQHAIASEKKLAVLGMNVSDPRGYGRLIRNERGELKGIVEERDADAETKKIRLCNTGVLAANTDYLFDLLKGIAPHNSQNEFYLTDVFALSASRGHNAYVYPTDAESEFAGINDRRQLEILESWLITKRLDELMLAGVTVQRPSTIYLDNSVTVEQDTTLQSGVSIFGTSKIGRNVTVGAGSVLTNVDIGAGSLIGPHSTLSNLKVRAGTTVPAGTVRNEMDFV